MRPTNVFKHYFSKLLDIDYDKNKYVTKARLYDLCSKY